MTHFDTGAMAAQQLEIDRIAAEHPTVICSVVSDDFAAGFVLMERSLRKHNPGWDFPVIVVESNIKPLSTFSKQVIFDHCKNVFFVSTSEIAMAPLYHYATNVIGTPDRLFPAFAVLEILRWKSFKRIIALDSDIVICGSLEPLLHATSPFSAVRATHAETGSPQRFVNTGVMVLNEVFIKGFEFDRMVSHLGGRVPRPGTGKADQAILNMLLRNEFLGYLPSRFNYTKRMLLHDMNRHNRDVGNLDAIKRWLEEEDICVFHYVGEKPWNAKVRKSEESYLAIDELWHQLSYEFGEKSLFLLIETMRREWQARYNLALQKAYSKHNANPAQIEKLIYQQMGL
ncbi:glycosyltransferase (plasmid) [Rhizobium sp. 32-5/1]|uniref:glycosyltransferase n=1 Tax=Rhizobium sp. 32-5/1 TaxID=3019602 RepID=UPI00240E252C|nr:glycosyltransferase [Rhizobium sp. 32-5/1]WEZ85813.1 glycosyltransferase [Rhizobium sp. 32-5/1]